MTQARPRCDTAAMDLPSPLQRLRHRGHPGIALGLLVGAALLLGVWGAWRSFAPAPANARERLALQARRIEALAQANATLARSDQISRQANAALQNTLAERDEEIAGLRADVAFYERFVGPTGQRRGLSVHALKLLPQRDPQLWHFVATLTQNLNRGAINSGRLQLAMEVTDGGSMRRLDWTVLRQQAGAADIAYAFRYFQRVEGDIVLPRGVRPVRVVVRLLPDAGATVERAFTWSEATAVDAPGG